MKLLNNQLRQAEFDRSLWSVRPEDGVKLEDMLAPEYWANVSRHLKTGARIEISPPDGTWFAELYVRSAKDKEAVVAVLRHFVFDDVKDVPEDAPYEAKFAGRAKWRVTRKSDKEVMTDGLTQGEAVAWIESKMKG